MPRPTPGRCVSRPAAGAASTARARSLRARSRCNTDAGAPAAVPRRSCDVEIHDLRRLRVTDDTHRALDALRELAAHPGHRGLHALVNGRLALRVGVRRGTRTATGSTISAQRQGAHPGDAAGRCGHHVLPVDMRLCSSGLLLSVDIQGAGGSSSTPGEKRTRRLFRADCAMQPRCCRIVSLSARQRVAQQTQQPCMVQWLVQQLAHTALGHRDFAELVAVAGVEQDARVGQHVAQAA
jgi:hypothetical protein